MKKIHGFFAMITKYISWIALAMTFAMMIITTVDVILRKLPIKLSVLGSYDMTEMAMVSIVFFGIAYYQSEHGHVRVDMFLAKFPYTLRCIVEGVVNLVEAVFGGIMCYAAFLQVATLQARGASTSVLLIPHWPFAIIMTIGLLLFTIFLFLDGIMDFMKIGKPEPENT